MDKDRDYTNQRGNLIIHHEIVVLKRGIWFQMGVVPVSFDFLFNYVWEVFDEISKTV